MSDWWNEHCLKTGQYSRMDTGKSLAELDAEDRQKKEEDCMAKVELTSSEKEMCDLIAQGLISNNRSNVAANRIFNPEYDPKESALRMLNSCESVSDLKSRFTNYEQAKQTISDQINNCKEW